MMHLADRGFTHQGPSPITRGLVAPVLYPALQHLIEKP
jgi:hypothetical protein